MMAGWLGALREQRFRRFWIGQSVSGLGDRLVQVAIVFAVLDATGSVTGVGIVLAATVVPNLLLLLVGGVWADWLPRQRVMVVADGVRALAQAGIAVLLLSDVATLWEMVALSAVYGAATAFFAPAASGIVPETVSAQRLQEANALMNLSRNAAGVGGPALAGLLVALFGAGVIFAFDSATFVVGIWFLMGLGLPSDVPVSARPFLADLRAGWMELRTRSWLWGSILAFGAWNLAFAPFFVLGPLVAKDSLGGAGAWGAIVTCGSVGSIGGSLLSARLTPRRPLAAAFASVSLCALPLAALAIPAPTAVVAAANLGCWSAIAAGNTFWYTTLQEQVPAAALGRVSSYDWLGSLTLQPIGFALAGPIAAAVGVNAALGGAAVAVALAPVALLTLIPAVRELQSTRTAAP